MCERVLCGDRLLFVNYKVMPISYLMGKREIGVVLV